MQTAGRGRGQRQWLSSPGKDLAFSFLISCPEAPFPIGALGMAAAIAVAETVRHFGPAAQLKWPNDVLVANRKIAGILVERLVNGSASLAVVGIGLNINMSREEAQRLPAATSLYLETGKNHEVAVVLDDLLARLSPWLERWRCGGWPLLQARWEEHSFFRTGQKLRLKIGAFLRTGILAGYGAHGEILLRNDKGEIEAIWSGEAESVHGE